LIPDGPQGGITYHNIVDIITDIIIDIIACEGRALINPIISLSTTTTNSADREMAEFSRQSKLFGIYFYAK
jgi:hypothetical protein